MKESKTIEFKEKMTDTFLKTVSAYANYGDGIILFGVDNDGKETGVDNPSEFCLNIENKINDNIIPKPDFSLSVNNKTSVVTLAIQEGEYKPYTYRGKAYKRNDTSTVEVDRLELNRLILDGSSKSFEELVPQNQDFKFETLSRYFSEKIGVNHFDKSILKTLELYSDKDGFNIAAALLADKNDFPGIDIVRFGSSIDVMMDRRTFEKQSVLLQYEKAIEVFRTYYTYEKIIGIDRIETELIPEKAFREATANAIVHRLWDINAHIRIEMYQDKIVCTSPGGLPVGINESEYLKGHISILRNPILGSVFFRLHLIEKFGTGIRRIKSCYKDAAIKPDFYISDNSIQVVLPILHAHGAVSDAEQQILNALSGNRMLSSGELAAATTFSKDKVIRLAASLIQKRLIASTGNGRGTKYMMKK